ncbi:MAG: hypothetical protein IJR13_09885 [Bacteroidales bacterium]|nr:hypothetical protein [Bacteroidales bacterium]
MTSTIIPALSTKQTTTLMPYGLAASSEVHLDVRYDCTLVRSTPCS